MLEQDMARILFTGEDIEACVGRLAEQVSRDYAGKSPIIVCTLRGAFVFAADLIRRLDLPLTVEFMSASSYGSGTVSSGKINIKLDIEENIAGRDVLIVEDILDSGNTLSHLIEELSSRSPASLKLCVLLDKPERRKPGVDLHPDYLGFTIPDEFVVGYGLDYNQHYRNLPYIGVLKPDVYN